MKANFWRWAIVAAALLFGLGALVPTFVDAADGKLDNEVSEEARERYGVFFDLVEPFTLGLDLQGGLLLQYNVLVEKAIQDRLDGLARDLSDTLRAKEEGLQVEVTHATDSDEIVVAFEDPTKASLINDSFMEGWADLTVTEGDDNTFRMKIREEELERIRNNAVIQAIQTIRQRVDGLGVAEPSITRRGTSDIVVQLPGLKERDVERAKDLIGRTALLRFRMVDDAGTNTFFGQFRKALPEGFALRRVDGNYLAVTHRDKRMLERFLEPKLDDDHVLGFQFRPVYQDAEKTELDDEKSYWKTYYIFKETELTGQNVKSAKVALDPQFNRPYTAVDFDNQGAELFGKLSEANVNKRMAIMLDDEVVSAPVFNEPIWGGSARISMGSLQSNAEIQAEANDLVIALDHGALQAPLEKQFETVVGPSLGQDSIDSSALAMLVGSAFVILFMAVYYRFAGLISVVALVFNVIFIFAALAIFGATLTLPGIAGIILTVGMAVDANVIIFERIREELAAGARARDAVSVGYSKALSAVLDANITTGIAGLVLLQFGTGPIKGFAVTLLIGIVGTIFTAVFVSRLLFDIYLTGRRAHAESLSI